MPKSFAESCNEISKFYKNRGSREGIGFLLLKMTKYVFKEENRKPFLDAHVEIWPCRDFVQCFLEKTVMSSVRLVLL